MSVTLPNMGLVKWDLTSDPYSHSQLAANFQALDDHDHPAGKGKQIPTGGIADGAITSAKIADGTIATVDLADASVTLAKLSSDARIPLGIVVPWWRPAVSVAVPAGWVVPTGQTLIDNLSSLREHDFYPGVGGSIQLPNLSNKFILGAATAGTGTDPSSPPDIGASGGSNTVNLAHTHTVNAHTHGVNAHTHGIDPHTHAVSDHVHAISTDTSSSAGHTFAGGNRIRSRQTKTLYVDTPTGTNDWLQTLYIENFNTGLGDAVANMDAVTGHSHGGATGSVSGGTVYTLGNVDGLTTQPSGAVSTDAQAPGTNSQLSATTDNRPGFVGLLYIMKVKF